MKKRGRKPQPTAKRRQTTREGRTTGRDPVDLGTAELRRKKRAISAEALPMDPLGALLARGVIELREYAAGLDVAELLATVARARAGGAVQNIWWQLLAGGWLPASRAAPAELAADRAVLVLARLARFLGSPKVARQVFEVCAGEWPDFVARRITAAAPYRSDAQRLADLRWGLGRIADSWGRRAA